MKLTILKIGGKLIEDEVVLSQVLDDFVQLPGLKILVHGGGARASQLGKALGTPAQMIEGRRITDAYTLEIVTMVYAGLYNKKVVAQLQARNCNALGLSGADGNIIQAHKRIVRTIDYGFAGDIDQIDAKGIDRLLKADFTPVFCAITHDKKGQLLNTNADTIAAELSRAMAVYYDVQLVLCLDLAGVLSDPKDPATLIPHLNHQTYQQHKDSGVISGGMIPKLDNAFAAIAAGVASVKICGPQTLLNGGTILR